MNLIHGHWVKKKSPTYLSWDAMKQRCLNPNHWRYSSYGGKGITICTHWLVFENFLADMGERPKGTTIDRIDNSKGYSPENCRWATPSEQNYNQEKKYIVLNGRRQTLADWAKELDLTKSAICRRVAQGWSLAEALTIPRYGRRC